MWDQHGLWLSCLWIVVVILTDVTTALKRKPVRNGTLDDDEVFKEIKKFISTFVSTSSGHYLGKIYKGNNDEYYQSFADVPYAKPPMGDLRFKKPEPIPENEDDYYDVSKSIEFEELVTRCKQYVRWDGHASNAEDRIVGSEDCLYLDIIRPVDLVVEHKLREKEDVVGYSQHAPVMVFLHPGTFMYDIPMNHYQMTEYFCCNFILFVFVRFRLGALGFLNAGSFTGKDFKANLGLWDQVAALKWVQRHIDAWGGDPQRVTLTGVAAGAASVNYHLMSEASRGLFHRAISVGGSALCPWAFQRRSVINSYLLTKKLSDPPCGTNFRVCLMQADADDLVKATKDLYVNFVDAFRDYYFQHNDFLTYGPYFLELKDLVDEQVLREVIFDIRRYYNERYNDVTTINTTARLNQMVTDRLYTVGIVQAARLHALSLRERQKHQVRQVLKDILGHIENPAHQKTIREIYETKVVLYQFTYQFSRIVDFLTSPVHRWINYHREEFALLTKDPEEEPTLLFVPDTKSKSLLQIEDQMRESLVTLWANFIQDGRCFEVVNSSYTYYYPDIFDSYTTDNAWDVVTTWVQGPKDFFKRLEYGDLAEMKMWNDLPIQIFDDFDDRDDFCDDDINLNGELALVCGDEGNEALIEAHLEWETKFNRRFEGLDELEQQLAIQKIKDSRWPKDPKN
ncbi:acetylcholinesterase [Nilaparvata lugens]|uniref:acetylcholinesterase n=1 Tax=Nilaparvata lugens TaxID=108931 RepID=UPI00193D0991|nr:acetylcholinesterase [Nilaparvata lugens]